MRRLAVLVVAVAALAAPAAANDGSTYLTQRGVGHVRIGDTAPFMERWIFERRGKRSRLEGGQLRLEYPRVHVYFRGGWKTGALGVVTWSSSYRTFEGWGTGEPGVGPCSLVSDLLRLHGDEVTPFRLEGRIVAYRLGRIWFTAEVDGRIGAVQVSTSAVRPFAALNSDKCRGEGRYSP